MGYSTLRFGFCFVFLSSLSRNFSAMEILVLFEAVLARVSERFMCVTVFMCELHRCIWNSDQKSALSLSSELIKGVSPTQLVLRLLCSM